jgi:hypothetical protein
MEHLFVSHRRDFEMASYMCLEAVQGPLLASRDTAIAAAFVCRDFFGRMFNDTISS